CHGETPTFRIYSHNACEAPLATLDNVSIDISVVLGRSSMPIHQVLRLPPRAPPQPPSSGGDKGGILPPNNAGGARHGHRQRQSHRCGSQRAVAALARSRLIQREQREASLVGITALPQSA